MRLAGDFIRAESVSDELKEEMFSLLTRYFEHVQYENFSYDLEEKDWVILLRDSVTGDLGGFSTQMLYEAEVNDSLIRVLFSGDTIVHQEYWGEPVLARMWGILALSILENFPDRKLYWFLIAMGYRTYRFLPVYFHEFFPRFDRPTPTGEKKILDALAKQRYGDRYNPETGVICSYGKWGYVKTELAEIPKHLKRDNDVAFFLKKNKNWQEGDELACLAEISEGNFKPTAYKILARYKDRLFKL